MAHGTSLLRFFLGDTRQASQVEFVGLLLEVVGGWSESEYEREEEKYKKIFKKTGSERLKGAKDEVKRPEGPSARSWAPEGPLDF